MFHLVGNPSFTVFASANLGTRLYVFCMMCQSRGQMPGVLLASGAANNGKHRRKQHLPTVQIKLRANAERLRRTGLGVPPEAAFANISHQIEGKCWHSEPKSQHLPTFPSGLRLFFVGNALRIAHPADLAWEMPCASHILLIWRGKCPAHRTSC